MLFQIDINHPLNTGTGPILSDADTVCAAFNPGSESTYGNITVHFERAERSSIRRDDAWLTLSITVRCRAWQHR